MTKPHSVSSGGSVSRSSASNADAEKIGLNVEPPGLPELPPEAAVALLRLVRQARDRAVARAMKEAA